MKSVEKCFLSFPKEEVEKRREAEMIRKVIKGVSKVEVENSDCGWGIR
jgi:hypothetical protein